MKQIMKSYFGDYGGMFVTEMLVPALQETERAFQKFIHDAASMHRLRTLLHTYAGRETPLYLAENLSKHLGFQLYIKREDLLHGGAHKTNNAIGQALLAKYMDKKEIIAETGAGQHGFAVALAGALVNLPVTIFMGAKDIARQAHNVMRMRLCGAKVVSVTQGSQTLKDAINEALRVYVARNKRAYYLFGSVAGPHPFPTIVRHFQEVIGKEARKQILKQHGTLPKKIIACVGGGSNAIGIFSAFLKDENVECIGVEAAQGASIQHGKKGIFQGSLSYVLQNSDGQIEESKSIAAGLDYPGVGPHHSFLKDIGRTQYVSITDKEALRAFRFLSQKEGIIPALESAHAIAYALKLRGKLHHTDAVIVNLSGRGDKDLPQVSKIFFQ